MNLHALRIFTHAAQLQSITEAAKSLKMTQPAVTIQIRNLENELQVALTKSKGRGIELTEAGNYVLKQGLRIFELEAQVEKNVSQFLAKEQKINIAASYISSNYVLPRYIANYKSLHDTELNISLSNVHTVLEKVRHYDADFGFVVQSETSDPDLQFEKLLDITFAFIVHPSHPLANNSLQLRAISAEPFIYREKGSSTRDLLEAVFHANNCPLPPVGLQMQGLYESLKAVEAGYGVILAPLLSVEEAIQQGKLAQIFVETLPITQSLFLCTRKKEREQPSFLTYIREQFGLATI